MYDTGSGFGGIRTERLRRQFQIRGGRTNSDGAKMVTIWSPTDEPAIEAWWVEKINAFNEEHKGEIELKRRPS